MKSIDHNLKPICGLMYIKKYKKNHLKRKKEKKNPFLFKILIKKKWVLV